MSKPHSVLYGLSISDIARICKVDSTTARRWKRGAICPPYCAVVMLAADLGGWDEAWRGWRLAGGKLVSPEGIEATPGEVRGIPFTLSALRTYQVEIQKMREEVEALDEQPQPDTDFVARFLA